MTRPRDIADSINRINSSAADATAVTIDSSENVGIGLTDPDTPLEVQIGSSGNALKLSSSADGASVFLAFEQQESGTKHVRGRIRAASNGVEGGLIFETGASSSTSERMRIDNSGNLLVGRTSVGGTGAGHSIRGGDSAIFSRDASGETMQIGRNASDGTIVRFNSNGTQVGSIGARSSQLSIGSADTGLEFNNANDAVIPFNTTTNGTRDNAIDLGISSVRFNDAFVTNGVTTGSDQNEKQQIATLTTAEIAAAKRISNGFKTFKWNDAVTAKGDNARTHTGVIAQAVRTALEAEGLDAGDYAFFMSDTWWETQTQVPAVEADEANGIEAKDAYTRTDVYNTADEAPEGATERTRLGIRYPELLAFVGAATEQRLTHLETLEARITALENAD